MHRGAATPRAVAASRLESLHDSGGAVSQSSQSTVPRNLQVFGVAEELRIHPEACKTFGMLSRFMSTPATVIKFYKSRDRADLRLLEELWKSIPV